MENTIKHANLIIHRLLKIIENKASIPTQNEQGTINAAKKFIVDNFDVSDVLRMESHKENFKAVELLRKLVSLKVYKDKTGKDLYYNLNQPQAWQDAKEYLAKLKQD